MQGPVFCDLRSNCMCVLRPPEMFTNRRDPPGACIHGGGPGKSLTQRVVEYFTVAQKWEWVGGTDVQVLAFAQCVCDNATRILGF